MPENITLLMFWMSLQVIYHGSTFEKSESIMTDKQKDDIFHHLLRVKFLILILMYIIQIRITCDVPI